MNHLIISRQYPPAPNAGGGIATYLGHIARLLAEAGETVHVIAQQWPGAPAPLETSCSGRLIVHRLTPGEGPLTPEQRDVDDPLLRRALRQAAVPCGGFFWQAAILAERLVQTAAIDVVEAQEYEAPAFPFLLRRAAGLGPARTVPVIVHLHTPTEFVCNLNGWEQDLSDYAPVVALERAVIEAADALLCPSRFLARIAESHYRLRPGAVEVIPYPMGDTALLVRPEATWRDDAILYMGRLEPRKGVIEWVDAAIAVAHDVPLRFAFVGGDTSSPASGVPSTQAMLRARIPRRLRSRFSFRGEVAHEKLMPHVAKARIAVIPSRWENFPYTCIEAMATGLPVLVSPNGGMAEMVEDGRTGWIAAGADARSLEAALRRAAAVPPSALADMGAAAAASIRALCDNGAIVQRQLAFRRRVVAQPDRGDIAPLLAPANSAPATARSTAAVAAYGRTFTALDVVRAAPTVQLAILRRAIANPRYARQWLLWHGRRAIDRLRSRLMRQPVKSRPS